MNIKKILLFFCVTFSFGDLYPAVKGSETLLSIEPYYLFPAADSDNTMLGFGWFKNGFGLEDATTSCTFDSVFPVSGTIGLGGGSLYLNSDLIFRNAAHFCSAGKIYGNNYVFDLCSSVTGLASDSYCQSFDNTELNLNGDLIVSGSMTFHGNCIVNGNGKKITLNDGGHLLIDLSSSVTFRNITIDKISDGKICCLGSDSEIVLDEVTWVQDGNYSFTQGSIRFQKNVDFIGSHTFSYESNHTSTITDDSDWHVLAI